MAIIKTRLVDGHRRVVTKLANGQRRVSCSCCEVPDCCMYPANALMNGLFSENDLPDELNGYIDNNLTIGTYTRSGNGYEATFTGDDGTFLQRVEPQLDGDGSYRWNDGWSSCACLLFCSDIPFTDNFADGYNYDNEGQLGFLERTSLCLWAGGSRRLHYYAGNNATVEFYYNGPPHRWLFIGADLQQEEGGGVWEKDDPQNGPAGTYSPSTNVTGNSFAGLGTVTLTAA